VLERLSSTRAPASPKPCCSRSRARLTPVPAHACSRVARAHSEPQSHAYTGPVLLLHLCAPRCTPPARLRSRAATGHRGAVAHPPEPQPLRGSTCTADFRTRSAFALALCRSGRASAVCDALLLGPPRTHLLPRAVAPASARRTACCRVPATPARVPVVRATLRFACCCSPPARAPHALPLPRAPSRAAALRLPRAALPVPPAARMAPPAASCRATSSRARLGPPPASTAPAPSRSSPPLRPGRQSLARAQAPAHAWPNARCRQRLLAPAPVRA
jgi:hypothetical protein